MCKKQTFHVVVDTRSGIKALDTSSCRDCASFEELREVFMLVRKFAKKGTVIEYQENIEDCDEIPF